MDGGMLWRNGCDGKVLRCGAGNRHQHTRRQGILGWRMTWQKRSVVYSMYVKNSSAGADDKKIMEGKERKEGLGEREGRRGKRRFFIAVRQ